MLDISIPTVVGPALGPADGDVVSMLVHFAPYEVEGGWTATARERLTARVDEVASVRTGRAGAVVGPMVLTPPDIETRYGVIGGHLHHGEHGLDQLVIRPIPEMRGTPRRSRTSSSAVAAAIPAAA